jgi:RHS repeat-associated protein
MAPSGDRVQKSNGKIYWYGAGSQILDESDASGNVTSEYVYVGGIRVARRDVASGNVFFYVADLLGSARGIVQSGQTAPCYDADFSPFGGERVVINTCAQNYKFEGKERDAETGNDDFGARYYSSAFGRFLSADWSSVPAAVPYANLTNPQTLNLYAIVSDNPETFADLDGHSVYPSEKCWTGNTSNCPPPADDSTTANNQNSQNATPPQNQSQDPQKDKPNEIKLPDDPSKLGPEWHKDDSHKSPNDDRYVNDKGEKLDWHKGIPGKPGEMGTDHWHRVPPDGQKDKEHYHPGDVVPLTKQALGWASEHRYAIAATGITIAIIATIATGGVAAPALAVAF